MTPIRSHLAELRQTAVAESLGRALSTSRAGRVAPVAYAAGMLIAGAILLAVKPRLGHVPEPKQMGDGPRKTALRRAAQIGRDNVEVFAPTNVTDSIGRSLLLGGTALLLVRLLDEFAGRDGD